MPPSKLVENIYPETLREELLSMPKTTFVSFFADTLLLGVRIIGEDELFGGLAGASAKQRGVTSPQSMSFRTEHVVHSASAASESAAQLPALRRLLLAGPHFVTPLQKRPEADTLSADRITIGRARNKDVVLRHGSVSKFHAWFELDARGRLFIADSGSRNGTRINGALISPRALTQVSAGTKIDFASVEAFLSNPVALWDVVNLG
jgi:hypothetical protein